MLYENFLKYPFKIHGITEASELHLQDIKSEFLKDLEYTGDMNDLSEVIPPFVFYLFLRDLETNSSVMVGETRAKRDESSQDYEQAIRAWNMGVKLLTSVIEEKEKECNPHYLSPINLF